MKPGVPDPQIPAAIYESRAYLTKERLCSYWHQLDEVLALAPERVLEVGPGPGLVTRWLRDAGIEVVTLDHDPAIAPDVEGALTAIPLEDDAVDGALCGQVLEHLPWDEVPRALAELARVSRSAVVLTVPDVSPFAGASTPLYWGLYIERVRSRIPQGRPALLGALLRRRIRLRDWIFTRLVPARWAIGGSSVSLPSHLIPHVPWHHDFDGQHYWEIGTADVSLQGFLALCRDAGLSVTRNYRVPENPFHRVVVATVAARASSPRGPRG
jgi:SAM-dependent methyltransferase